jgi:hypothetical protein
LGKNEKMDRAKLIAKQEALLKRWLSNLKSRKSKDRECEVHLNCFFVEDDYPICLIRLPGIQWIEPYPYTTFQNGNPRPDHQLKPQDGMRRHISRRGEELPEKHVESSSEDYSSVTAG